MLKVSLIKLSFDNSMFVSNPWYNDSDKLNFMVMKGWSIDDKYIL